MQKKVLEWVVLWLLQNLDASVAAKALIGFLRACCQALKDVAKRTETELDDKVVAQLSMVTEELAKALKVD